MKKRILILIVHTLKLMLKGVFFIGLSRALRLQTRLFGKTPKRLERRAALNRELRFYSIQSDVAQARLAMFIDYLSATERE